MKRRVLAVLALLPALSSTRLAHAEPTSKNVTFARAHYAQIERNLRRYDKIKADLSGYSTEGGELTAYYAGGVPRKIVAQFYGETGKAVEEYYFWGGALFFVLRTELRYDKPIGIAQDDKTEIGKVVRRAQDRFYFANGKLIRWIANNGKVANLKSVQTAQHERKTLQDARRYLQKANKLRD